MKQMGIGDWLIVIFLGIPVGDALPIFWVNEKLPPLQFENLADYPDWDFYVVYGHGPGNPAASPHRAQVYGNEPFRAPFERNERVGPVVLLAAPHGVTPPTPRYSGTDTDWFRVAPPGCIQSNPLSVPRDASSVLAYSVRLGDNKLNVTLKPGSYMTRDGNDLTTIVSTIIIFIGLAIVVTWLVLRSLHRRKGS
jgi:hypothetical protein